MTLTVTPFVDENHAEWAAFVDDCKEAWLYHRPESVRGISDQCSFSLRRYGRLVGVCVLARLPRQIGAVLAGPGLALSPKVDRDYALKNTMAELRRLAKTRGCQAVEFDLPPLAPAFAGRCPYETLLGELGFSIGVRTTYSLDYAPSINHVIDLSQDLNSILMGLTHTHRTLVRRCEKSGLKASVLTGAELTAEAWDSFVLQHHVTYARTYGKPWSETSLNHLADLVRAGLMALATIHDGPNCVATLLLDTYKRGINCRLAGSLDDPRKLGVMAFAYFSTMGWAKSRGYTYYLVGPTYPTLKDTRFGNSTAWKGRLGGEKWEMLAGELIMSQKGYFARIWFPAVLRYMFFHVLVPTALLHSLRRLRTFARNIAARRYRQKSTAVVPETRLR